MLQSVARLRLTSIIPTMLALAFGIGWASREVAHGRERATTLVSQTINLDQIKMGVYKDQGHAVGQIGLYIEGETPGCSSLVTGRFIVDTGKSPHPPHVHQDEEILIVEAGQGEIICDGKTTKVGPGSVMYSTPNVAHGINNTGQEPLTFTFVKWTPRGSGQAK